MPRRRVVEVPKQPEEETKINELNALVDAALIKEEKRDEILEIDAVMADITRDFLGNQDLLDKKTWDSVENLGKIYLILKSIFAKRDPNSTNYNEIDIRSYLYVLLGSSRNADRMMEHVIDRLATEQLIAFTSDHYVVFRDISEGDYIDTHPNYEFYDTIYR